MFEQLSERFGAVFKKLKSRGKLHPKQVDAALDDIRAALLEADVAVVMMAGLQGSGKTTACAKLALHLREKGRRPMLVAADLQRPAAVEQLVTLGQEIDVPVATEGRDPVKVAKGAVKRASKDGRDVLIVDTAGRLHVDREMMREAGRVRAATRPHHVLMAVDATVGQDAVRQARAFMDEVDLTGFVITKLDGDARGGAALSVTEVTRRPVYFAGVGEKPGDLEPFHPERMAKDRFTLEDFLTQLREVRKLGPLQDLLGMLPGGAQVAANVQVDEGQVGRAEAIISSMTPEERRNPAIIGGSRRSRIARGSGTSVGDVNVLLKQFDEARKMMKRLTGGRLPKLPGMPRIPGT